jgi:hypothetical protein
MRRTSGDSNTWRTTDRGNFCRSFVEPILKPMYGSATVFSTSPSVMA